jgi:beta-galactosidase/beta-glucuronidase
MIRLSLSFLLLIAVHFAQAQWKPVAGKISTDWTAKVTPSNPLPEYPRPQMQRKSWMNLNGLWQYAILSKGADKIPESYEGQILVPYAVESSLSGVGKTVGENNVLWYSRTIDVPAKMKAEKLLLHFGAVDWLCKVYVNGKFAGEHSGGYDAFSFDITALLKKGTKQSIAVQVWDPSDEGPQPRGKQVKTPKGIWYTPVTGIWQTVWLENVPQTYIVSTKQTPDIDKKQLAVGVEVSGLLAGDQLEVTAWDGTKQIASVQSTDQRNALILNVPNPKLWSPASPFLYDLKVSVKRKGKLIDEVASYFGMRKSSIAKDAMGIQRMMLNNQFVFQYGPLDQGWWPDGLYTAPTEEALKFDIEKTKALGFNMIRKHVKVEPARWYYLCDKIGMLVWQDMPSGDNGGNVWDSKPGYISGGQLDKIRSPESEKIYRKEWKAIMDQCHNYPSIVCWVPFNEAWGQFKTREIVDWTTKYDPSRLVNAASGGNFFMGAGQVFDLHIYPAPAMPDPEIYGAKQALVLGEFGGLGLPVEGHTWLDKGNWGYQSYQNKEDLFKQYTKFVSAIPKLIRLGLSAAVYTQTTDVEIETNGLFTYDRKVLKMPLDSMYQLHQQLYDRSLVK